MKIKLNRINNIDQNDILKRIEYIYSLDDSSGLLKIELTMYNKVDELENFLLHLKDLYKFNKSIEYKCYYKNYKYLVKDDNISKIKMY